uniref:TonB-dependent receptor domain-containing protein n=1 Tax=Chitinimonas sp. TaxID=1934313 RepID=UPI0035B19ABB
VIVRDPSNGSLIGVINRYVNFGTTTTRGVDFDVRSRWTLAIGKIAAQLEASYVDRFEQSDRAAENEGGGISITQYAGRNTGTQTAFPRTRGHMRVELDRQDWLYTVSTNYISDYAQSAATSGGKPITNARGEARPTSIPAFITYDLGLGYRWGKHARINGTIRNITDKLPPFDPRMSSYGFAVDQYAPISRTFNLSFTYKFD